MNGKGKQKQKLICLLIKIDLIFSHFLEHTVSFLVIYEAQN